MTNQECTPRVLAHVIRVEFRAIKRDKSNSLTDFRRERVEVDQDLFSSWYKVLAEVFDGLDEYTNLDPGSPKIQLLTFTTKPEVSRRAWKLTVDTAAQHLFLLEKFSTPNCISVKDPNHITWLEQVRRVFTTLRTQLALSLVTK